MGQRITNFVASLRQLTQVPPTLIDGTTYVLLAGFMFLQTFYGGDEAARFVTPEDLFHAKRNVGLAAACLLALKLYRSTQFAEHQKQKQDETKIWRAPEPPKENG